MEVHIEFENGDVEYYSNIEAADEENEIVSLTYYPEVEKDIEELENASIKYAARELGY